MRILIIGSGFIGRAVAARLALEGHEPVLASRNRPAVPTADRPQWIPLDVGVPGACAGACDATGAEAVVLVHGPSDVTWCEANPLRARHLHAGAAANVAAAAAGRRVVLISTDNVFDGSAERNDEQSQPRPHNAYGRAKLAAERIVCELPSAVVLRVSLVYGWEPADGTKWLNFFASCVHRLRRGEPVAAPDDHWTTPVLVDDVASVTAAVTVEGGPALLHLGGPDRLTRAEWAGAIASRIGAPSDLVVPTPRAAGRYASRPVNACLDSRLLARHPSTAGIAVRGVQAGLDELLGPAGTRTGVPEGIRP